MREDLNVKFYCADEVEVIKGQTFTPLIKKY